MNIYNAEVEGLCRFLDDSVCNFYAVDTLKKMLDTAGFKALEQGDAWRLHRGGKYYVTKNGSAIFAFIVGDGSANDGFKIISAHSDSPCFRIKPKPEMLTDGNIIKLNTEVYGGPILYTWFDRPLSIAGRVLLKGTDALHPVTRLVRFDRPLLTIPHLAIHFNRAVNEGNPLSRQKDMLPVIGAVRNAVEKDGLVMRTVAERLGIEVADILDMDLSLYDTTKALPCRL